MIIQTIIILIIAILALVNWYYARKLFKLTQEILHGQHAICGAHFQYTLSLQDVLQNNANEFRNLSETLATNLKGLNDVVKLAKQNTPSKRAPKTKPEAKQ